MFEFVEMRTETESIRLRYHLAPWDEVTVGAPVAVISELGVIEPTRAAQEFKSFRDWYESHRVALISCRLPHDRLSESAFLEEQGFRFIELNYRPELAGLQAARLEGSEEIRIERAVAHDEGAIADIASEIFDAGRFHRDPMIDPTIGNLRYRRWVSNAFRNPAQAVVKCIEDGRIVAFFVVECPEPHRRFWSLVGLAPGLAGRGMGSRVWRAMLHWHRREGVDRVSTSISSLNVAVQNLYVKLGFRFPAPEMTFHCCPLGPIRAPA